MDVFNEQLLGAETEKKVEKKIKEPVLPKKTNFEVRKSTETQLGYEDEYTKEGYLKGILPCGVFIDGVRHQEFELQELDGDGEEYMMSEKIRGQNITKGITYALTYCLKRLGNLIEDQITDDIVRKMFAGDRDYLYYKLRTLSAGNLYETNITCNVCGANTNIGEINIKDFQLTIVDKVEGEPVIVENFTKPIKDKMGKVYNTFALRLLVGADQEALNGIDDYIELKYKTLSRILVGLDASALKFTYDYIKSLPFSATKRIWDVFVDKSPGVDFKVQSRCSKCQTVGLNRVGMQNFLF